MLNALSPLEGRYSRTVEPLRPHLSEAALVRERVRVEMFWLLHLGEHPDVKELPKFDSAQINGLWSMYDTLSDADIQDIEDREYGRGKYDQKGTRHDVKAMMNHVEEKMRKDPDLEHAIPFLHFGLTSEDVNNLSYGNMVNGAVKKVMVPQLEEICATLRERAEGWADIPLMGMTHGQPATRTTVGEQLLVFVERFERQLAKLRTFTMQGKFGGAVGNYASISVAYPEVNWPETGKKFVERFGLQHIEHATQSNPHDDLGELSNLFAQINAISKDLSQDMWLYISRGVFKETPKPGETGSSTMTHKVNPIDWENAEGNIGVANALWRYFAEKLPVSRMQRDLSDSPVLRNMSVAFGHTLVAWKSMMRGLGKVQPNEQAIDAELDAHPETFGEAIQLTLRRYGDEHGYAKLAELTRGKNVTVAELREFVDGLPIPGDARGRLTAMLAL